MNWQIFIAMIVAIPIILLPVVFLWYLNIGNIGGIFNTFKNKWVNREKSGKKIA
jgi:hypothetical protein